MAPTRTCGAAKREHIWSSKCGRSGHGPNANERTHPSGRACSGRLPGCRLGWSPLCAFPPVILSGARNAESKDPVRCQPEAFLLMPRRILRLRRGALSLRMAEVGVSRCARDDGERQRRLTAECEAPGKNFRDCEELHAVYFWRPGIMLSTFRQGLKMNPKNRFRHRNSGKSCHLSARGLREGKGKGKGKGKGLALTFEGPEAARSGAARSARAWLAQSLSATGPEGRRLLRRRGRGCSLAGTPAG